MDTKSQMKVCNAGFVIIRKDDQPAPRIKYKNIDQIEWKTLEKFERKTYRDKAFDELLENQLFVSD